MNTNITELVFILDRSGSMSGLESDTIGGFNAMLKTQQAQAGQVRLTTVLFDNEYFLLHDRLDLNAVRPMTNEDYYVRGSTALLDAIGRSIMKVDSVMKACDLPHRPDKVLFVIITDGMENASHRFTRGQIAELVGQRRKMGWEFIFLGANMDATTVAGSYGIDRSRAETFINDSQGVGMNFESVSRVASDMRASRPISADWSRSIRERGRKKE